MSSPLKTRHSDSDQNNVVFHLICFISGFRAPWSYRWSPWRN